MNYAVPRKRAIFAAAVAGLTPRDVRRAYNVPDHLDGSGQTIALLEFGSGYSRSDIDCFAKDVLGLAGYDLHFVSLGEPNEGGREPVDLEATLDIQWALAMAPAARIVVYEAPPGGTYEEFGQNLARALRHVVDDEQFHPDIVSISYGDAEQNFGALEARAVEEVLAAAAQAGITVFVASGDQGAYGEHRLDDDKIRRVEFPASCPHAIAVGGTSLSGDGGESSWTYFGPANGGATGGGISELFEAPAYQTAHLRRYGTTRRGVPDVAAVADPATGCLVVFQGRHQTVGGTSLAAPIWAGICALVNQALGKRAGFFLPQLYADPGALKDVTSGNNTYNFVPGFEAGPGWDPCTGLGSPDVGRLIEQLSGKAPAPEAALGRKPATGAVFLVLLLFVFAILLLAL